MVVPEPPAGGRQGVLHPLQRIDGDHPHARSGHAWTRLVAELEGLGFHERDDAVYVTASVVDVA